MYPRNFGTSDHHGDFSSKAVADDVARYMWKNKISTATFGGHGLGASFALKAAIEHYDRTSGFFAIDYTPVNYNQYKVFQDLTKTLNKLKGVKLSGNKAQIIEQIGQTTTDEKWKNIFQQCLISENGHFKWNFNFDAILSNVNNVGCDSFADWNSNEGLYPGRSTFLLPEESDYVFIGTNTLPIYNTFVQNRGYNKDIFSIQSEENSNSKHRISLTYE